MPESERMYFPVGGETRVQTYCRCLTDFDDVDVDASRLGRLWESGNSELILYSDDQVMTRDSTALTK